MHSLPIQFDRNIKYPLTDRIPAQGRCADTTALKAGNDGIPNRDVLLRWRNDLDGAKQLQPAISKKGPSCFRIKPGPSFTLKA